MHNWNKPHVKLISITEHLSEVIDVVWEVAKTDKPLTQIESEGIINNVDGILSADLPTSEFVNMVWVIEGMPRTFWDQLDRTRIAAFWEQSVRILDCQNFADNREYWLPEGCDNLWYHRSMHAAQETYRNLLKMGVPSEQARGVLPLHINVRGSMSINLRAFKKMISSRTCFIAQGDYWQPIIKAMAKILRTQLPEKTFESLFRLPCAGKSECPIASNVKTRLTDEDPNPICPVYLKKYVKNKEAVMPIVEKKHPNYSSISDNYYEFLNITKG